MPAEQAVEVARRTFAPDDLPLVLVVGSHEPRKNHVRVLEAAELLWRSGCRFRLAFVGGNAWGGGSFEALVDELRRGARPVEVHHRVADGVLHGAYALARFTVFPSLIEGFGLPILESLAVGTPVITSNHGSMAELAMGGGCVTVDPRDVSALVGSMRRLLSDDGELNRLAREAQRRPLRRWQDFSRESWSALTST
jgi:glycosyltransferase involved in cell wall biosynthesis